MGYVQTGLGVIRENDSSDVILRETGFVTPAPLPSPSPLTQIIIGGNGTRYRTETMPYGRGFVPAVRDALTPLVHPFVPGAPTFEVDDSRIVPQPPLPSILPAESRSPIVSEPIDKANAKVAFEMAEAQKYGYTHAAWMALGSGRRCEVRRKYPGGYNPVTPSGVSAEAARVDLIAGRDPIRLKMHETGAGDHEGGIEIANPQPSVPLVSTRTGITFDDILRVDPVKIQTPAEAAGLAPGEVPSSTQDIVRFGLMAVAGWIFWDMFVKPKKRRARKRSLRAVRPGRRRTYLFEERKRRLRQGWQ